MSALQGFSRRSHVASIQSLWSDRGTLIARHVGGHGPFIFNGNHSANDNTGIRQKMVRMTPRLSTR